MKDPRIAFFGSPSLAARCLRALLESFRVELVVTNPDKIRGRGRRISPTPVKELALRNNIDVFQSGRIDSSLTAMLRKHEIDLNVVVAFGKILPEDIIHYPRYGSVNLHASLLPKLRGPSPVQSAILNGETKTGITLQMMKKEMDAGDILATRRLRIDPHDTAEDLMEMIIDRAPSFLLQTLKDYLNNKINPVKQNSEEATYCSIIKKEDGRIDWNESTSVLLRKIKAYNLWPVAFSFLNGNLLHIFDAFVPPEHSMVGGVPGEIVEADRKAGIIVKTGDGAIGLSEVQLENRKRMSYHEFMNGYRNLKGSVLTSS